MMLSPIVRLAFAGLKIELGFLESKPTAEE
jgi:hypothetical protein